MTEQKKILGTGLDSLLGGAKPLNPKTNTILELELDRLVPGQFQPRSKMHKENLKDLVNSIKSEGILQPVIVKSLASGRFEIVVGERRWRAAKTAGLKVIPAIVRELNNDQTAKISLIENIQREDLNAMDVARGLKRLQMEFNLSQEELSSAIGKSRSTVANFLRLMNLSLETKNALEEGKIEMGHARALLGLGEKDQALITKKIIKDSLSVREVESLVKRASLKGLKQSKQQHSTDPNILMLEKELADLLNARVSIQHKKSGKGRLVLSYKSLEQLQGVLEKLKK